MSLFFKMNANNWIVLVSYLLTLGIFVVFDFKILWHYQSEYEEGNISLGYKIIAVFHQPIASL